MSKITSEHLARSACVYIRQSTADQLVHNHESRRRQYGLADRARQLGWTAVEVIDDDLGRSGGGINRPGFERLLAAICEGRVGAVLAIEASRLARNGRDWHTLIEFCGLVGTIIVDEDGIDDPRHPNDRLLLGMKGTMSELELSLFRQRSHEALKQKARRGALFLRVAAGYVKAGRDRIEKDPDQRVQDALRLVFSKFAEFQSARQVHVWLRDEGITLPVKAHNSETRGITWRLPAYNTVHNILTNPIYAGAYAFGRTTSRVSVENGRKEGSASTWSADWQGGDHTPLQLKLRLNAAGRHHWPVPEDTKSLVRELARLMPDRQIARLLNRCGKPTGYGNGWTQERVRGFRNHHDIAVYREGELAERGEITLEAAAQIIGVTKMTALRMIRRGDVKGRQICKGAPWVIKADDMAAFSARKRSLGSVTPNPAQQTFGFQ